MRICLVTPNFPSLKVPNYIEGIFRYRYALLLKRLGYQVFVVTTKMKGAPSYEKMDGIEIFRVTTTFFPKYRYPIPVFSELIRTIMHVTRKYKVDVIEFNNHNYLTALPIFFVRRRVKIPVTVSVDGLLGITYSYGDRLIDFVGLLYTLTLGKEILKRADGLRLSYAALIKHLVRMGIVRDKLYVIYNAVDLGRFQNKCDRTSIRKGLKIGAKDVVVLYVGRLDNVKGVGYLIISAKKLLKRYKNLKFILVGDGSLRNIYEKMATNFKEEIVFTGTRRDIASLMAAADIFVLPSLSEGCPNVVLEAAATGMPVVATNVGGTPEIVSNSHTGLLVQPKKSIELEKAIEMLIKNPEKAQEMGEKAHQHVLRNFSMDVISQRISRYYQKVLGDKRVKGCS